MTINEATTIIKACITGPHEYTEDQCFEAFSLGIEALVRLNTMRSYGIDMSRCPLGSETRPGEGA